MTKPWRLRPEEAPDPEQVWTVSALTTAVKDELEQAFGYVYVEGEISNLARPRSGHAYMTLKDDRAQLRAVMWRSSVARLRFDLEDGLEVVCAGRLTVYEPRGDYQIVVDRVVPKGVGALELAFRKLREKLAKDGLFDPAHKKPLPVLPRRLAVVTSPTGAAIRDILQVLSRRFPNVEVWVVPVAVQGEGAPGEIASAIRLLNTLSGIDVMIVGRGGGSLEDLWAFNEEVVARAIYASTIPVISAVGHEIDLTIADLVADRRALTPTEAAELVVPSRAELVGQLDVWRGRLVQALVRYAQEARARLRALSESYVFRQPYERIQRLQQRLDDLAARAARAVGHTLVLQRRQAGELAGRLDALSPLKVMSRGYSITLMADGKTVLRRWDQCQTGHQIQTRLHRGRLRSQVIEIHPDEEASGPDDAK